MESIDESAEIINDLKNKIVELEEEINSYRKNEETTSTYNQ